MEEEIPQRLQRKRRRVQDLEATGADVEEEIEEYRSTKATARRQEALLNNFRAKNHHPLTIINDSGLVFPQVLGMEQVRTASGDLLTQLKAHLGVAATVNPHKAILVCVNADTGVLDKLNYNIKLSNRRGGDLKPLMNEDYQFPPHSLITPQIMQGDASNLCEFYALESVDPETDRKTLEMFLGSDDLGTKLDDLGTKVDEMQRTLAMLVDQVRSINYVALRANESITDRNAEFALPIPVTMLPEGFPAHDTVAKLEGLSRALLREMLTAYDVPFQEQDTKAILIRCFLYDCGARNLARQVAQNNQNLSEN